MKKEFAAEQAVLELQDDGPSFHDFGDGHVDLDLADNRVPGRKRERREEGGSFHLASFRPGDDADGSA